MFKTSLSWKSLVLSLLLVMAMVCQAADYNYNHEDIIVNINGGDGIAYSWGVTLANLGVPSGLYFDTGVGKTTKSPGNMIVSLWPTSASASMIYARDELPSSDVSMSMDGKLTGGSGGGRQLTWHASACGKKPFHIIASPGGSNEIIVPVGTSVTYYAREGSDSKTSKWKINNIPPDDDPSTSSIIFNRDTWDVAGWFSTGVGTPNAGTYSIWASPTDSSVQDSGSITFVETQVSINGLFDTVTSKSSETTTKNAYVHWNIDNDNDSTGGTTTHPGGDYLENNTVNNENDLKPLSISITPSMEQGTVTLNSIGKIWTSSTKGDSTALLTLPKTWDLSNATERSNFNSIKSSLYIEGNSNTNGAVSFSLKDGSTTICTASITCHFISANCGDQPSISTRNAYTDSTTGFPGLVNCEWSVTGAASSVYNCIAWSVGETNVWYNSVGPDRTGVISIDLNYGNDDGTLTVAEMDSFYDAKGYTPTTNLSEALILYYSGFHGARKKGCSCGAGKWLMFESKCGQGLKLEHVWNQLNGTIYGTPIKYYKSK